MSAHRGRRLALVFAHPDDETYAMGASIARYAHAGVHIALFCATDGAAGKSSDVPVNSQEELAAIRRNELHAAARHLGIRDLTACGHPDTGLTALDPDVLIGDIVRFLRRVQPEVVVTFGPEGAPTGHPDHRAISRAATAAFFLAALPTEYEGSGLPHRAARLYYTTFLPPKPGARLQRLGLPPTARLDARPWERRKREAFMLHATQRVHQATFEELAMTEEEWFALASGVGQGEDVVGDLLEGL
ncbi:MAG: PIG-L family deacetylase [Gemmatimonadaceae bacterium]|nr:PIG-L family deacetylase [Gemmatimonadaceae bacterium]